MLVYVIVRFHEPLRQVQFQLFEKTHKCLLFNNINTKKICVEEVLEDLSSSLFSPFENTSLQSFPHKLFVITLRDIIGLEKFI